MKLLATALLLLALVPTVALATPASDAREGRVHYDRGMAQYALANFDVAVEEFKLAFELTRAPALLFNLAQASRLAKKYDPALHFYRAYLRALPNAPNRADAEKFIEEIETQQRASTAPRVPVEPEPRVAPEPSRVEPVPVERPKPEQTVVTPTVARTDLTLTPAARSERRRWLIAGGTTAGVGAALLATGIYFGEGARSSSAQVSDLTATGGPWNESWQKIYDDGQRDAKIATALFVVGGVALGAGAIVAIVGSVRGSAKHRGHRAPAVAAWQPSEGNGGTRCGF